MAATSKKSTSTRPKKAAAKPARTTATRKTSSKKTTPKRTQKTVKRVTTTKKSASKTTQKRASKKKSAIKPAKNKTVTLPPRMSMRAQEKTLVLAEMFERDFFSTGVLVSRVAGLCFILIGGFLAMATVFYDNENSCGSNCLAQVATTDSLLQIGQAEPVPSSNQTVLALATLPSTLSDTVTIPLEITSATDVSASLQFTRPDGSRGVIALDVSSLGNDKYSVEIRGGVLQPNSYELKVEVRFFGTERYQTFTIGSFLVPNTAPNQPPPPPPDSLTSTTSDTTEIISDQEILSDQLAPVTDSTFAIFAPREVAGIVPVSLTSTNNFAEVEFFVRPVNGINSQRVGSVGPGETVFRLNSFNLPNGSYELFAKGIRSSGSVTSDPTVIRVFNRENLSTFEATAEQERELLIISRALNEDLYDSFEGGEPVDETITELADDQLATDKETIDALFEAYAVAQQSGDEALIQVAEQEIENYRQDIISAALLDENDRYIADELDQVLDRRLANFRDRVKQFEELRRERTENDSSIDTDQDGVSDVDETVLYKTDPTRADTDGDGFTDGAEIIGGFNPLSEEAEAAIIYESPKELVAVVKTDKLIVEEVVPDIVLETASTSEVVQTVVRGKALPNSFVTLYVFSTPTIVTVRTDDTGAFEYVFTKELEDGEHQVFAALTDNSGAIIAQSEPFTFVKEARAFTPVDAAEAETLTPVDLTAEYEADNSYRIVIGMAVLALGILLILLGFGLRHNKPEEAVIVTEE